MRIAMVSEHASPLAALGGPDAGGQNVYVARLSEELARRGHDVTVHTRRDDPDLPDRVRMPAGTVVDHVDAGPAEPIPKDELLSHMPEFGEHLDRVWARERPDAVHAHFWMSGLAALDGARPHGIPVVQTFHALGTVKRRHQGALDTSPVQRIQLERQLGRRCDRVIATCSDEVAELAAVGVPDDRVTVVPCGVDTTEFRPGPDLTGAPGRRHRHRLLACGRLVPRKGYDRAVRALAEIPDAELVLVGGPFACRTENARELADAVPEAARLLALAEDLGVADRVRMLGAVSRDRMPALMRSADLVLCTPSYEPFGIVPLEAMACAVPVLATDVGGHRDSVADRATGRLVPPDDPRALARAARELLGDDALRRAYGAAGRARVLDRFTWRRVADGVEEVYRQVAAGRELSSSEVA
jgi:glycosyltransferase involved in cell wall biosynthesis